MTTVINTDRLVLRPWTEADAVDALAIYGHRAVAARLPADVPPVTDECAMLSVIRGWLAETQESPAPAGHLAVELQAEHRLIGGCSLSFGAPGLENLKLRWVLSPTAWDRGYTTEAGDALILWAMHEGGVYEVYAAAQPNQARAQATARRMGTEWVGGTGRCGGIKLQVYRVRHDDLAYRYMRSGEAAPVDAMGRLYGHRAHLMPLGSPDPDHPAFGRAVTMINLACREDLTSRTFADVFHSGGIKLVRAQDHHVAGVVTDSRLRDFDQLRGSGFATCAGVRRSGGAATGWYRTRPSWRSSSAAYAMLPGDSLYVDAARGVVNPADRVRALFTVAREVDREDVASLAGIRREHAPLTFSPEPSTAGNRADTAPVAVTP